MSIEAAQKFGELGDQEEIGWALAGGLVMHLYGSQLLTTDLDINCAQSEPPTTLLASAAPVAKSS